MTTWQDYTETRVTVPGGELAVVRWSAAGAQGTAGTQGTVGAGTRSAVGAQSAAGTDGSASANNSAGTDDSARANDSMDAAAEPAVPAARRADAADSASDVPVLLVHGITANALAWAGVADEVAGRAELIAVDLRGRAGSREVGGPWGIERDVQDIIAVLDALGIERGFLAGHSLGAFVATAAAAAYPDRFTRVVAVDGGLGFPLPPESDPDSVLEAVVGPAVKKLSMTFADEAAYLDFHRVHPAFVGNWSPQLTAYLSRDSLRRPDGTVVSSCIEAAIRADGKQVLLDEKVRTAINGLSCPVDFVYAARGLLNEDQALYDEQRLELGGLDRDRVRVTFVPDTNHYTVIAPSAGARTVAGLLLGHGLDDGPDDGLDDASGPGHQPG